ncbi:MAM and LDL-receptor class A domain-containing protein 2 [Oncorhynchus kisutch]|nr:MAM and LDL-receptor class A domain-containing protein 2 [Oncorhynchus kisutch]
MRRLLVLLSVFLILVSCCPESDFLCASGKCVPVDDVCDFKDDCDDGSDEEFCGSCDFERHSCGWNDSSVGVYRWRLEMANISLIPGQDHTTGSPWGHVMHVEGDSATHFGKAVLLHSVDKPMALGCHISFWYHLYDDSSVSARMYLKMIRTTGSTELLMISKPQQNRGWENATAFIGNQPGGFKLEFSVDPSFLGAQDIMLDDISFESCGEGDIPAGSQLLTCDFEKDTCAWYPDQTVSLLWKRARGIDHTTGSGYFMSINPGSKLDPSSTARLISYPQPAGTVICVSFWYRMYGSDIGSVRFLTKSTREPETVVWMRHGTQGNKWRFTDLTFTTDTPLQFILEAVVGGKQGSIVIDDMVVSSSSNVNGSCPAERECTFQGSLCGLQVEMSGDFTWNRTTGALGANTSSPALDHTLGTELGYYLSAQLWNHHVGSRGRMITGVNDATPRSGECWMFWYHMEGRASGELNIYLQPFPGSRTQTLLWSRTGDQGDRWRHGRTTVLSPDIPYQVIFEAVAGDGREGDIAIDDLTLVNGPCPPQGFCDFEMDYCGWLNSPPAASGVDWEWWSGSSGGRFSPTVDHTTNSGQGHYIIFSTGVFSSGLEITQLQSEPMEAVENACIEFWYFMDMWGTMDQMELTVYVNETGVLRSIWSRFGQLDPIWYQAMVDYNATGPHQIIFSTRRPGREDGGIALDDIHVRMNLSCAELIPTTSAPTTVPTTPPATPMDCTFEHGLCNCVQETDDAFDWVHSQGLQVDQPWNGPLYDHTVGNDKGFYLMVNMSGSVDGETAVVSVPLTFQTTDLCVGFWYYMLGPSVSTLDLLVQTKTSRTVVWTRQGSQDSEWMNAQVQLGIVDTQEVQFSGSRNTSGSGFIAIDDVTVKEGACKDQHPCGFEVDSWCDFEVDVSHKGRWGRLRGRKDRLDHTYRTENGFYLTVLKRNSEEIEVAQLLSSELSSTTGMCVRFWYWLPAGSTDRLSVHVLRSEEQGLALWQRSGAPSTGWEVAELTVSAPNTFKVVFRAEHAPGSDWTVQIDDVSMREGACTPTGSCDFESGQCTWVNEVQTSGHDWVQADGRFHGPDTDHTSQTPEGRFLLSPALPQNQSSRAVVVSEWIQSQAEATCLTIWYHMNGSESGALRVFERSGPTKQKLLFETQSGGSNWTRFSGSVEKSGPFQVLIDAESGDRGFIAVDDIIVTPGLCPDNGTSGDFVGCSFENGTCDWADVSVGQFTWQRGRNGTTTENTGPSLDHTLGTELGWYMAVESSRGDVNSFAALQSPTMKQASAVCLLEFYYHMYGTGVGELRVHLQEGSRTTPLWWRSGDQGDAWRRGEVIVGRTPHVFTLFFQATRTFSQLGDIAIDDILFLNCSLPEPQDSCPAGVFTCSNRVCVAQSRVCDYTDDCGDGTDEADCEKQGYEGHCSFEQGLCSWEESEVDTPGADWTFQKGESAWPQHGPPRDHTKNNGAGHYVIPGSHLTEKGQTSELLSSTLLPSSNCTVRFFYYSQDEETASLTMRLRTDQDGADDTVLWTRDSSQDYSWHRAEVILFIPVNSKIVFQYKRGDNHIGLVAVDDVSFFKECVHDPNNSQLPVNPPSSVPPTNPATPTPSDLPTTETTPTSSVPPTTSPCTFESDQCLWSDTSEGVNRWQRQEAGNHTVPETDHTTGTGFYMAVNFSQSQIEARLQSPALPSLSPYCQILFHFQMRGKSVGSLTVLLQEAEGKEVALWSRTLTTAPQWRPEHLPLGQHLQPYKVVFRSLAGESLSDVSRAVALDDISFLNCDTSYQPPALSAYDCSFERDLCGWMQGAEEEQDWQVKSGPTDTPNTGPAGDHTTTTGYYLYIESSAPSIVGSVAQLKSQLLPPAGPQGYCLSFWYHMFGPTVGSLRMVLHTTQSRLGTLVWYRGRTQGDEWRLAQSHVTLQEVHLVVLEGSVGGEAGDIAIDDITFTAGLCAPSDLCDFEESSCNWLQQADDDGDWVRGSGSTPNPNTGPDYDHTTNTATGHYFYLPSSGVDQPGQTARMASPLFPAGKGVCLQLWYHMSGRGMGTLNVYQWSEQGALVMLLSRSGDQGALWRFAQATLQLDRDDYRIIVEGVKGSSDEGDMAFDDILVSNSPCPPPGRCDFQTNLCGWTNVAMAGVDEGDWLRGRGASPNPNTGPSVDHTTNSSLGYYLYVDSSVGQWGDRSMLVSEILQADSRGYCLTFWFHMYGPHIGTLNLYRNDRKQHASGGAADVLWTESGSQGDVWLEDSVYVDYTQPFWFVFMYWRGRAPGGDVALDDITIHPGHCYNTVPTDTPTPDNSWAMWLGVVLSLLAVAVIAAVLFVLPRKRSTNLPEPLENVHVFDLSSGLEVGRESELSFFNTLYDPSSDPAEFRGVNSDA